MMFNELVFDSDSDSDLEERPPRKRVYRERINYDMTGFFFKERFRITKPQFEILLGAIGQHLKPISPTNHAHSAEKKILTALHFLGNGAQYHGVSDMHGSSKASVCRFVHQVVRVINTHYFPTAVNFPENAQDLARKFYVYGGFPYVAGAVDGTLIKIDSPHENEHQFVDRKGDHSLNVMVVCGPDMQFLYISSRWPGAVNDARVLRNSSFAQRFESGWRPFENAVILADSGYPLNNWLIPPLIHNLNQENGIKFNRAHKKTRRLVECTIGLWKEKFPCLNYLRLNPIFAAEVIKSCAALHNLALIDEEVVLPELEEEPDQMPIEINQDFTHEGRARQNELLAHFN